MIFVLLDFRKDFSVLSVVAFLHDYGKPQSRNEPKSKDIAVLGQFQLNIFLTPLDTKKLIERLGCKEIRSASIPTKHRKLCLMQYTNASKACL